MMQSFRFFPFTVAFFFISTFCRAQLNANFTSSVISGCVPLTVNFTNTSTGNPASYNWNFGNGNSSILENPSATYSLPGTYTVKLMVSNSSASDQEIKTNYITVYSNPVAAFTVNPDTACAGSPVTFTSNSLAGTAGAINHWRWSFDDGYVDSITGGVAIHTYSFAQVFHANLIISDVHGCNSTISKNVVTVNGPIANFVTTPASGCNAPINISFTNTTSGFVSGYQWNFGDPSSGSGNVSTLTNPNHLYNNTGTYNITLIANSALCTASFSYSLQIIHTAAAFSTDTMICLGDTALFSNITIPSNASYSWDFGDGSTSTSSNPFHVFQNSNFFTVQLTATANGCIHTTSHIVHVRTRPNATILATPSFSCLLPQIVSFSVPTPNIAHWLWNFDDPSSGANNTSALASPSHTYTLFGIDTPYVIVTDVYGCKDTAVLHHLNLKEFTVGIQSFFVTPTAQIPLDSGCVPLTLLFEGTININSFPPVQYVWNFGDSTGNFTSSSSTITHTFTSAGHFHVTLTVTNQAGCSATDSHWITTGTLPDAGFAWSDTVTCFGGTVTMYNTTPQPVTSWSWNFGDGQIYTGYYEQISHIFDVDTAVLNPLTITMVAFNNGCPDTIILQNLITVLPPKPLFAYTHSCSTPLMLNFINESIGATNYQWDFGDTTTYSTDMSPAHVYLNSGFYSVNLTAFDSVSGCSFTKNYNCPVTIPVSNFTASPLYGCYPLTVNFTDNSQDSDPNYYHWNFGDPASFPNDTSVLLNPNHLFNSPGTYDVVLKIVDIFNCPDSSVQIIHVFGTTAGFTSNLTSGCSPFNVVFDDTSHLDYSAVLSHQWNFGNGSSTVNSSMVSNSYSSPGSYSVTLTVVDTNGCHSSITQPNYITVYLPEPTLSISDTFACPGQSVTFAISSGNNVSLPVNYQINYGDFSADSVSVSSTNQSFSHTYSSNNSLLVTVLVTDTNGCDSLVSGHLTILKPAANYSVTTFDTCINQPPFNTNITTTFAYFTNLSTGMPGTTGNSWHWNFGTGSGTQSVLQNPSCHYNIPGYYTPQLIVTNAGGCSDTARLDSIVNVPGPNGSFSFIPAEGCAPLLINFSGSSSATGLFYTWDFGDGNVSSQVPDSVVTHLYLQDGMYYPFYYIGYTLPSGSTCNSVGLNTSGYIRVKTFMTVNINPAVVEIPDGYDTTVVAIVFDTTLTGGPPFIYNWSPSANIHSTDSLALVFLSNNIESAYYYCTVTNAAGCKATDSLLVLLFPCDVRSIIPNVFTPNDDGINDTYHITYLCAAIDFKFSIFNRWGKMIYESSDPDFHWNGKTVKGDDATEGTYYYVMHAHRRDAHGMIELIRREKK